MRKAIALIFLATLSFGSIEAKRVDPATARGVAETWLQAMGMRNVNTLVDVTAQTPFTEFYVFAAPEGGFILVSGDDCAIPVLGYSVDEHFETKDMPRHVFSFLTGYDEEIKWAKEHIYSVADTVTRQWKLLTNGQMPKAAFDNSVLPLLTTCWDQAPYYNELCPLDSNGNHFMTGCVATATAQVMKYWNYPTTGYGSHTYNHYGENGFYSAGEQSADFGATTYDWAHMPYRLTALSTPEEVEAVATLMYQVGVGEETWYDYIGSGSNGQGAKNALVKFFKYAPDATGILRHNYSDSEYCAILRAELDQGRPLMTGGDLTTYGGHEYNCDGYTTRNYFHFNLGWGNWNNGYFALSGLIGLGYISLTNNSAIIGIHPNYDWDTAGTTSITTSVSGGYATVTGAGTYSYGATATLSVDSIEEGFFFRRWSDGCMDNPREIYTTGGTYHFTALLDTILLITNDTISYCGNRCRVNSCYKLGNRESRWGVWFPPDLFPHGDTLHAVQVFTIDPGNYILEVYVDSTADVPVYSDTSLFTNNDWNEAQWHTIPLSSPVVIDSSQELWITFRSDAEYPAAFTQSRYHIPYESLYYNNLQYYMPNVAWMIRGILHPLDTMPDTTNVCDEPIPTPYFIGGDTATFTTNAACWSMLDADGDGNDWFVTPTSFYSISWMNTALTPNNWLFSPAFFLHDEIPYVLEWTTAIDERYPHEHYGVYLSTTGGDTSEYELVGEYDCDVASNAIKKSFPLDDYMGDTIYIAFRHFNSTDQDFLCLYGVNIYSMDHLVDVYSNNSSWGSVSGSGSYAHGSSVTVSATPNEGYSFQGWSLGTGDSVLSTDNPYSFIITKDTVFTAQFINTTGIGEIENGKSKIEVHVADGHIIVEGAEGETLQVFDMIGRQMINCKIPNPKFEIQNSTLPTGVYMLKIGDYPSQKINVIRK